MNKLGFILILLLLSCSVSKDFDETLLEERNLDPESPPAHQESAADDDDPKDEDCNPGNSAPHAPSPPINPAQQKKLLEPDEATPSLQKKT